VEWSEVGEWGGGDTVVVVHWRAARERCFNSVPHATQTLSDSDEKTGREVRVGEGEPQREQIIRR